jgi:two-component system NarL family sensor kinase
MLPLARFTAAGFLCVMVVGLGAVMVERQIAQRDADRHARLIAQLAGRGVLEPNVTPALLRGDRAEIARLDRIMSEQVISAGIVRVKLWTADGRIVYSDLRRLIGKRYAVGSPGRRSLSTGGLISNAADLEAAERRFGSLLEVRLPFRGPGGERLLFEVYVPRSDIARSAQTTFVAFLPVLIGALVVLLLGLLPFAYSMARRLVSGRKEREALMLRSIEASENERRRIAGDLHDGVVQALAGTAFHLSAAADRATADGDERGALLEGARQTRSSIRQLRSLLVDIYPPDLHRTGLAAALSDLVAPLESSGLEARLRVDADLKLPPETEALLYRAAHEALRNVHAHAAATHVDVRVTATDGRAEMDVADDGRGFSAAAEREAPGRGHFGLRVLGDMVHAAGGRLDVVSEPGRGTRVSLAVPVE